MTEMEQTILVQDWINLLKELCRSSLTTIMFVNDQNMILKRSQQQQQQIRETGEATKEIPRQRDIKVHCALKDI